YNWSISNYTLVVNGVNRNYNVSERICRPGYVVSGWNYNTILGIYTLSCASGSCSAGEMRDGRGLCLELDYNISKSLGACPNGMCYEGNPVHPGTGNKFLV